MFKYVSVICFISVSFLSFDVSDKEKHDRATVLLMCRYVWQVSKFFVHLSSLGPVHITWKSNTRTSSLYVLGISGYHGISRTKRQNLTLYLQVPRLRQKHPHWLLTGACHSPSAAAAAAASAVDAALFSPVFPTRSHPGEPTAPRILLWTFTWPKFLRFCDF